jgi:hypothetical protein
MFSVSVLSMQRPHHLGVKIIKSGVEIGAIYAQYGYITGSVTVFTQCDRGEKVSVRARAPGYRYMHGNHWPAFSGALLQPK